MLVPRVVIAGTQSGVGKTTLTVGIIAALHRRGLRVQPFKVGPDYIDPSYHTLVTRRPSRTLDTWMIPRERIPALFARAMQAADVAVIEGVMGLYDGFGYDEETGSTAEVAKLLVSPVVLVLDASRMARSAGAIALGYREFDHDLHLAGFIVNRVGSESHGRGVARAIEQAAGLPVLGWIPRHDALNIPERHLGLIPTAEPGKWHAFINAAGDAVERHLDVEGLLALALRTRLPAPPASCQEKDALHPYITRPRSCAQRPVIAVASDEAFSFLYPDNLDLLRLAGADIVFFSPLRDDTLPPKTAGVILSGGFPEVHAAALAENQGMHRALREAHDRGLPIYAECGGLMYLTQEIVDQQGQAHPMAGLLPGRSVMTGRLTLGYRLAQAVGDSWFLRAGERVRGHEFHYSVWEGRPAGVPAAYWLIPPHGNEHPRPEGAHVGNLWASFVHVHFWAKPGLAPRFVDACARSMALTGAES